jgi:hypothetical protein
MRRPALLLTRARSPDSNLSLLRFKLSGVFVDGFAQIVVHVCGNRRCEMFIPNAHTDGVKGATFSLHILSVAYL